MLIGNYTNYNVQAITPNIGGTSMFLYWLFDKKIDTSLAKNYTSPALEIMSNTLDDSVDDDFTNSTNNQPQWDIWQNALE